MIAQEKAGVKSKCNAKTVSTAEHAKQTKRNAKTRKRVGAMFFRFEITKAQLARKPVVGLFGWLREGDIKKNDKIQISYTDATKVVAFVVEIDVSGRCVACANARELEAQIWIVVTPLEVARVEIGSVAAGVERKL